MIVLTTERLRTMRDHYKQFMMTDEVSALLTLALDELLEYREAEEQSADQGSDVTACPVRPRAPLEIETGKKEWTQ